MIIFPMESQIRNNFFLCVTEYHILLSILISTEVYNTEGYNNTIILCNGGRFNNPSIYNFNTTGNINYKVEEEKDFVSDAFIRRILSDCTNSLFLFNLNYPHFTYIAYLLKQRNVPTSLVQDGLGLYMFLPFTFRERVSNCKWSYNFLKTLGIKDTHFMHKCFGRKGHWGKIFCSYDVMAESDIVSYIWLTSPEKARYAHSKVKRIPEFSINSVNNSRSFFNYNCHSDISLHKNDFLFVDQRIDGTSEFIHELSNKYQSSIIYVKLHPRSPRSWADSFKDLPNVKMIDSMRGIPIELLTQTLQEGIVLSAYSAALLLNNPNCKFFYVYPWYAKRGYGKGEFEEKTIYNPTQHIRVISSINEIEV